MAQEVAGEYMLFVNPTGLGMRSDAGGAGHYGARRGKRTHNGVDYECTPGQHIFAPHHGKIVRESLPYATDSRWRGIMLVHKKITTKLWYMQPAVGIVGQTVVAGQIIGTAQDISTKKGYEDCGPHVHLKVVRIDPLFLMGNPEQTSREVVAWHH